MAKKQKTDLDLNLHLTLDFRFKFRSTFKSFNLYKVTSVFVHPQPAFTCSKLTVETL